MSKVILLIVRRSLVLSFIREQNNLILNQLESFKVNAFIQTTQTLTQTHASLYIISFIRHQRKRIQRTLRTLRTKEDESKKRRILMQ